MRFDANGSRIGLNAIYQLSKLFMFDSANSLYGLIPRLMCPGNKTNIHVCSIYVCIARLCIGMYIL